MAVKLSYEEYLDELKRNAVPLPQKPVKVYSQNQIRTTPSTSTTNITKGLVGGIAGGVMSIAPMAPSPAVQKPITIPTISPNPFKNPLEKTLGTTTNASGRIIPKYTPLGKPISAPKLGPFSPKTELPRITGIGVSKNMPTPVNSTTLNAENKPWYDDAFAQDRNYIGLAKQGDIAGAAANFVGTGLQAGQSLYLNAINKIDAALQGKEAPFIYNMDKATYDRQVMQRRGIDETIGDRISEINPILGGIYGIANESLSDPTELLPLGMYDDIAKSIGAVKPGSFNYGEALKAGTIVPKNSINPKKISTESIQQPIPNAPRINEALGSPNLQEKVKTGPAIWANKDVDQPVNITGYAGELNGRQYVNVKGSKSAIPVDEIKYSAESVPQAPRTIPDAAPQAPRATTGIAPQPIPRAAEISQPVRATSAEAPTFGKNTVGSAERQPGTYSYMQNEFGVFKPGEAPRAREVDVPLSTTGTDKVSRFTRTTMESKATPDSLIQNFEDGVAKGDFSYSPKTDKKALDAAISTIEYKGYADSLKQWDDVIQGRRLGTKDDMVLGQVLYSEAANAGDSETAMKLAAEIAAEGTRLGQNVQALRMLKKLTPDGKLYYAQKSAQNIMDELKKTMGDKAPNIQIDKSLADELLRAKTPEETDNVVGKIMRNIADQVPATWLDKWNAWRYLSMLGNPKTHIRNLLGNAIFTPARKIKNIIGAGIESAAGITGRTKSILAPADSSIKKFASADFSNVKDLITEGGKLNPETLINSQKTIFKTAPLEAARKFNNAALEWEDGLFLKGAYADSMAQYIKANKYTPDFLNNGTKDAKTALESARKYAILEAQKATYRDASKVANALNRFKKTNKVTSVIGEGLIPFTKTPVNILKRGTEYSPAGLIKGLTYDLSKVKSGEKTAAEAIDSIASGLTGTGIMALGAWLASMGIVSGGRPENKKESDFGALQGEQNYAVNINGKSYTIDWMAPVSLPLFVGVEVFNQSKGENPDISVARLVDSMTAVSEPMVNMSMLQGINSAIKTAGYSESPVTDIGLNTLTGYLGQAVPTASGQVARAIDPLRRSAYVKSGAPLPAVQRQIQNSQAKIPFASQKLQPRIDQWGRAQENAGGSFPGRLAYNSLSPGYISQSKTTALDQHLSELYKATSDAQVLPGTAPKYFTVNKEKYNLSGEEHTKYAQLRGQTSYKVASSLLKDSRYKTMDDQTKADSVKDAYDFANEISKNQVNSKYEIKGWIAKAVDAQKQGIDPSAYIAIKNTSNLDEDGGTTQAELSESLFSTNLTAEQKAYIYKLENPKAKINPFKKMQELGLSQDAYARYYQALLDVKSTKRPNGKTISGSLERNRRNKLMDAGATLQEANAYIKAMYDYE